VSSPRPGSPTIRASAPRNSTSLDAARRSGAGDLADRLVARGARSAADVGGG
jgi:hypothetical protein